MAELTKALYIRGLVCATDASPLIPANTSFTSTSIFFCKHFPNKIGYTGKSTFFFAHIAASTRRIFARSGRQSVLNGTSEEHCYPTEVSRLDLEACTSALHLKELFTRWLLSSCFKYRETKKCGYRDGLRVLCSIWNFYSCPSFASDEIMYP